MPSKEQFAAINATLNGLSGVLLVVAYLLIKRKLVRAHATVMLCCVATSAIFLTTYLTSQFKYGDRSSGIEHGPLRTFYLVLLASHVLLAVGMLPMILTTLWRAYRRQWDRHRRIAKPTFWIWLYVSITGVVVYWMLYHLFPAMRAAH